MFKTLFLQFIEDLIRNIGGGLGIRIRRLYYSFRLKSNGKNLIIDTGVHISNPQYITVGNDVWIDKNVIIIAGKAGDEMYKKRIVNIFYEYQPGEIVIGNHSHIGISTIIQGHGGILLGNYFTSSAGCKIYTLSNDPKRCYSGTVTGKNNVYYVESPVSTGENVWLGLNVCVVGGHIGKNTFITPQSVVFENIEENSYASGIPAKKMKERLR